MSLEQVEVLGVLFDVYYNCQIENDPYGTGDSPTSYDITIVSIETAGDTQDLQEVLANYVIEQIIEKLIKVESN